MIEIIFYSATVIICLFILYSTSKSDFVLLRQNISLSQIFDAAIVSGISAFLLGRVIFMVDNFKTDLLSFIRFFHIIKFPGLAIFGILLGGLMSVFLIFMKKKGAGRICDIFTISFFPLFIVSLLFESFGSLVYVQVLLTILSIVVLVYMISSHNKYILRDGSIALLFITWICIVTFANELLSNSENYVISPFTVVSILCLIFIPISFISFLINQRKKNS